MELFLMRHGPAEDPRPGEADEGRALSPEGARLLRRQAAALDRLGFRVERLFTSPLRRARETAALLGPALGLPAEEAAELRPGCTLADVRALADAAAPAGRLLLVGHQPDLGRLLAELTGAHVHMAPGALAGVRAEVLRSARGVLIGFYEPEFLARAGD